MQNVERETNAYPGWIKNNINIINSINNSSIIIIIIVIIIIIIYIMKIDLQKIRIISGYLANN